MFMFVFLVDIKMFCSLGFLKYFVMVMFLFLIGVKLFGVLINGV